MKKFGLFFISAFMMVLEGLRDRYIGSLFRVDEPVPDDSKVTMKDAEGNIKGAGAGFSKKLSGVPAARVPGELEKIKEKLPNVKALIDFTSASNFTQRSKSEL